MDPRIGELRRDGVLLFYAFCQGYDRPETVGTLAQVEAALGVQPCEVSADDKMRTLLAQRVAKAEKIFLYSVTVTPKITSYHGTTVAGPYTVEVLATSAKEAIKVARAERRESEGRLAPSAVYSARRVAGE